MTGCSKRNFVYFENLTAPGRTVDTTYAIPAEQVIQIGDVLSITVRSPSPETDRLFNLDAGDDGASGSDAAPTAGGGYVVGRDGYVTLPLIGRLAVAGRTKPEVSQEVEQQLATYMQDPVVNLRHLNGQVTILGEVKNPATLSVSTDRLTLLQALGMAGDMTVYGDRENVVVIREINGQRTATSLDISDPDVLNSPFYFLQSNDVVYVEPIKTRAEEASMTRSNISIVLSLLSIITFLVTRR